jgi:hypothetical protein
MSTKTTFKRLALVTVAALGLGVLSVAPSSAAVGSDTLAVTSTTASQTTSETMTAASIPTVTLSFLASAALDSMSVTASLVSGPTTGVVLPRLSLSETTAAFVGKTSGANTIGETFQIGTPVSVVNSVSGAARVTAKFKLYLADAADTTAPATVGTYVVKVTPAVVTGTLGTLNATAQTVTFTVTAAGTAVTAIDAGRTTVFMAAGETVTATADAAISGSKTASSTTAIASIVVDQKNANGTASTESITATITGAGVLGAGTNDAAANTTATPLGRSINVQKGQTIYVFPDGTGGVGTITISTPAGVILSTKTVNFYGDIAAVIASVGVPVISAGKTTTQVVNAFAYDSAGYIVPGTNLYAYSSDNTIIDTTTYVKAASVDSDAINNGRARFSLAGVKAGTASIRVGVATSATDVTTTGFAIKSDAVSVRVGGMQADLADVLVSFDKLNYAPGSVAYVTIKPVDKTGAVLAAEETYTVFSAASGTVLAGLTPSAPVTSVTSAFQISSPSAWGTASLNATAIQVRKTAYTGTADTTLVAQSEFTYRMVLPVIQGDFTLSYSLATMPGNTANSGAARVITATISDPGSQAAVDAAAEATDAANAATDAALAAADAADAATAAAEDASAAVAQLSKSVTTALNNLKKQITSLTALVNKLLKR